MKFRLPEKPAVAHSQTPEPKAPEPEPAPSASEPVGWVMPKPTEPEPVGWVIPMPGESASRNRRHTIKRYKLLKKLMRDEDLVYEQNIGNAILDSEGDPDALIKEYEKRMLDRITHSRARIRGIIAGHDVMLVAKLLELAKGVRIREMDSKGETHFYDKPPDREALIYLLDKMLGKTPIFDAEGPSRAIAQVQIVLPHNNREDAKILDATFITE